MCVSSGSACVASGPRQRHVGGSFYRGVSLLVYLLVAMEKLRKQTLGGSVETENISSTMNQHDFGHLLYVVNVENNLPDLT